MNDGLKNKHRQTLVDILAANPRVERVVLFGSRAMGTYSPESDIDLALYGDELTLDDLAKLKVRIEETTIPQQVDLILVTDIDNEKLLRHIREQGVEWFRRKEWTGGSEGSEGGNGRGWVMGGEWRSVPVSEVALIRSGKRPPLVSKEPTPDCNVPVYGGGGLSGYTTDSLYLAGGLVTGRVGTLGKLHAPRERFWLTDNAFVIVPSSKDIENAFLRYCLEPSIPRLAAMNRGAANPLITQGDVGCLVVPLPPLSKQRAIAQILGTLDDKIELNRQMNHTLEAMAQALFKSWFVDFDPVVVNALRAGNPVPEKFAQRATHYRDNPDALRLPEDTLRQFPDRFQESELGAIPEGWEFLSFENFVEAKQGKYIPKKEMREISSGEFVYPVWGGNGIRGYTSTWMCEAPVVVLTCRGSNCGLIGLTDSPAWISNISFSCKPKYGSTYFLHTYFSFSSFKEFISGSAQPQITYTALKNKRMEYPVQRMIMDACSNKVDSLYRKILNNNEESSVLASIRDTLLPKLISGELRVPDAETIIKDVTI